MEYSLLIVEEPLLWIFRGWKIRGFFEPKSWWKYDISWLLKISCFELFGNGKYSLFWDKKLMKRWYLLITEKFLFWATKKLLFWTFQWWEIWFLFSQKVDVKKIFIQSFWVFYDIPEPGKYSFCVQWKSFASFNKFNIFWYSIIYFIIWQLIILKKSLKRFFR